LRVGKFFIKSCSIIKKNVMAGIGAHLYAKPFLIIPGILLSKTFKI